MKTKIIWSCLVVFLLVAMLFASCTTSSTTPTTTQTPTKTSTGTSVVTPSTTTKSTTAPAVTTQSTTASGNWWDKLGKPTYGGVMVVRNNADIVNFDQYGPKLPSCISMFEDRLFVDNWTLDPAVFSYKINWRPSDYVKGQLAESWEFTDLSTLVVHLRKGIHWQNLPPANGREVVAGDIVYHYQRSFNLGSGMTPSPYQTSNTIFLNCQTVAATDNYTVVFKWKIANPEVIMENITSIGDSNSIECPEEVKLWGDLSDWHHVVGSGPFILKDVVSGASVTLARNPTYSFYDERYPQNQLPYVDSVKLLIITDNNTALAGLRTGKIDITDGLTWPQAQTLMKTNSELLHVAVPSATGYCLDPRNDVKPFSDIRVRKAMQMAIDLPTIASTYYGGTTDSAPLALTSYYATGWGLPYNSWPQDLKDEYAYNSTKAKQLLSDAGYPTGFKTNIVADNTGDLDLLQIVKSYYDKIGITMDITLLDRSSWISAVQTQMKFDQMAYKGGGSMLGLSYEPNVQFQRFLSTYSGNYIRVNDPVYDAYYPKMLAASSVDQMKQLLKDLNLYVAQQHYVIGLFEPTYFNFYQPWLNGYSGQNNSMAGSSGQLLMIGFYTARFWINSDLKKSMGY